MGDHVGGRGAQKVILYLGVRGLHHDEVDISLVGELDDLAVNRALAHDRLDLDRRLNVIVYLNEGWDPDWGGALELWSRDMS